MVAFPLSDVSHEKKYHSKIVNENNHSMSILLTCKHVYCLKILLAYIKFQIYSLHF